MAKVVAAPRMQPCRSREMRTFDVLLFSVLFTGSIASSHAHAVVVFMLLYVSFWLIDMSKDDDLCTD
jgi:hypothetical protein